MTYLSSSAHYLCAAMQDVDAVAVLGIESGHGPTMPASPIIDQPDLRIDALCAKALSDVGKFAVIGGLAAAELRGLWLPPHEIERPETILVARGRPSRSVTGVQRKDVFSRRCAIRPDEIEFIGGIPVTTAPRTWVRLGAVLEMPDLVALGDSILRLLRPDGFDQLSAAVRRSSGHRGVVRARTALPLLDERSRSRPESHLRYALVSDGLPSPEVNIPIRDEHGGWLAEPDLVYPEARLALEYNGAGHAAVRQMRRDIARNIDADLGGWRMVTFGPAQVFGHPHIASAYVRGLLDERDPGWRRRLRASRDACG